MRRRPMKSWVVSIRRGLMRSFQRKVEARSYGHACRLAFRFAIATKVLKRQPRSNAYGEFEGVHAVCLG